MKYPHTAWELSKRIYANYPDALDRLKVADKLLFLKGQYAQAEFPAYLLWMLRELQAFDDSGKAGRWLGWVMRSLEILNVVTLQENRDFTRIDKQHGDV